VERLHRISIVIQFLPRKRRYSSPSAAASTDPQNRLAQEMLPVFASHVVAALLFSPRNPFGSGTPQQALNRDLTERRRVLHAQTLGPFVSEVAPQPNIHECGDRHRDQRAETRERHVFVRIPDVSLRAEISGAAVAAR